MVTRSASLSAALDRSAARLAFAEGTTILQRNLGLETCQRATHSARLPLPPLRSSVHGAAPRRALYRRAASSAEPAATASAEPTDFNWQLGLALAGCAFEAYNGLESGSAAPLRQVSSAGTQVTYVDKAFMKAKLAGVLVVTVVSASGLRKSDWWPGSRSDPYAVVSVGGSSGRTPTLKATLEPRWEHTVVLYVRDPQEQRLLVRVLDEDLDSDDLLGAGARGLADLGDGEQREVAVPLGAGAGTVMLRLQLVSFTDQVLDAAAGSRMGGPVLGSPARALLASPWRDLKQLLIPAEAAADAMFDPVALIENPDSDTEAWVFANVAQRTAVVAFRGTEQTKWKDVLTDLSLVPASFDPEGINLAESPLARGISMLRGGLLRQSGLRAVLAEGAAAAARGEGNGRPWAHAGFLKAYLSVRAEVQQMLDTALGRDLERWTVYVTGHSLGGALATLCGLDCAKRATWRGPAPAVVVYNYGSPRVGNAAFAAEFNALVPNAWRVVNSGDAVTQVPRLLGYAHVGHKVVLSADGGVHVERDSSGGLGEGAAVLDFASAVVSSALGSVEPGGEASAPSGKQDVEKMLEAEVAAMNGLLDGSALAEHLEPNYLQNMRNLHAAVRSPVGPGGSA